MADSQIIKKLIFKIPDDLELKETAKFYLRAFKSTDLSKVADLVNFWKLFIEEKICYFIIAKYNEKIIGCGALVTYRSHVWVAWMAVDPDFQQKGVGNKIMRNLMDYAKKSGFNTLRLDATNVGKKLYSKFEFREEYRVLWHEIKFLKGRYDFEGSGIAVSNHIPKWCLKMDKEAFGDDRSRLLKLLLNNGGKIITVENEGDGILWKNRIGPIIAEDVDIAKNIVRYATGMGAERLYVPLHKDLPQDFLFDLKEVKRGTSLTCCTRMIFGDAVRENTKKIYASFIAATG
ncbi:MAG: GNAT family N-acetyltransferase [Thermoplasmata archaeon]|nr:MAG: GNAT family N-acetyltransferase [Thermoplasmata archaeon]